MACLLSAVLGTSGMTGVELILCGGFLLGAWSAISPAIGQNYTNKVTDGDGVAMGHFGSLAYYISAWVGSKVGSSDDSTENIDIPEKWGFLRDTTVSTGLTMMFFYIVAAVAAGPEYVSTLSNGMSPILFAIMSGLQFAVGVTVVYSGVRMILGDLIPAFEGISNRVIPNAIPAVDCAVFFTYAPTAVVLGFVSSFIGGIIGMLILGVLGGVLIIPGMVPHFFCGATAGIYGNATGGKKGAMIGAFVNGLLITFAPALLLPVLGSLGFQNTTFGDFDFGVLGIALGLVSNTLAQVGIFIVMAIFLLVLVVPNFMKTKNKVINNTFRLKLYYSAPSIESIIPSLLLLLFEQSHSVLIEERESLSEVLQQLELLIIKLNLTIRLVYLHSQCHIADASSILVHGISQLLSDVFCYILILLDVCCNLQRSEINLLHNYYN